MATTTAEQELLKLEEQYWQAIKDKDLDAAMRLTDDASIITGHRAHRQAGACAHDEGRNVHTARRPRKRPAGAAAAR
jgi:hypothetical protein